MKQKDIALIIVAIIVSGILSLVLGRVLFAAPKDRQQKVEVVDAISTDFAQPDNRYFNVQSINPTQLIQIGENTNTAPFNGTGR
ncbi:MAG TPA: hypothetical protein VF572_02030 [Candidatus Saccharimonadales bacterium]|jgi:hypothetical protein